MLSATICRRFLKLADNVAQKILCDLVDSVVVIAELGEITRSYKVNYNSILVAHGAYLGVLYCRERVGDDRKSCHTKRHKSIDVGIVKRHLSLLIGVFIVHIVDAVHCVYVESAKPRKVSVKASLDLGVVKHLVGHRLFLGSEASAVHIVNSTVEREKQKLCKVSSRTEELHLLADLHRRHTAGDSVIVAVGDAHKIVVLVLDRVGINRKLGAEALKARGKLIAPKHREVRLGSLTERVERVENSERALCYERAVVLAHTANALGYPHRISAEKLVVLGRTEMTRRAKLDNEIVYDLLRACLVKKPCLHISLNVNIKEGRASSKRHSRAVLLLICGKIAEISPLHCLASVSCRETYIYTVKPCHLLELLKKIYLAVKLLKQLYGLGVHNSLSDSLLIGNLLLNKTVNAIKRNSAVVAYYSSSAVGVGKSREKSAMPCRLHLVCVNAENPVVVSSSVSKVFLYLVRELISVGLAGVSRHTDTAEGINASLKRLVGLKSHDYFLILINIACRIVAKRGDRARVNRKHTTALTLYCLKLLQTCVERNRPVGSTCEKARVSRIGGVVLVDEIADVDMLLPIAAYKVVPCLKLHKITLTFPLQKSSPKRALLIKKQSTPDISELPRRSAIKRQLPFCFWRTVSIHISVSASTS